MPVPPAPKFLYVTGQIPGNQTQIFGYQPKNDGTLTPLNLPVLTSPYCCHQAASAASVLYVADFNGGIAALRVDQKGGLTPLPGSPFPGLTGSASGIPVSCGQKFLFVTNGFPGGVFAFTIGSTGALSQVAGSPFPSGTAPGTPTTDPSCRFLFVPNAYDGTQLANGGVVYAYAINSATGALTAVPGSPFVAGNPTSILNDAVTDTLGRFLYVPDPDLQVVSAFAISSSGLLNAVPGSPFSAGKSPIFAVAVTAASKQFLYVASQGSNDITAFSIDSNSGRLTRLSQLAIGAQPGFLVSAENFLYSFNLLPNTVAAYAVHPDGTLASVAQFSIAYQPTSAAVAVVP